MKKDFAYYLPSMIVSSIVGFLSIKLYSSYFSTEMFGYYSTVTAIVGISSFLFRGINSFFFRFYSEVKGKNEETFYNTIFTLIFVIIIITFLLSSAYFYYSAGATDIVYLKLIALGLTSQAIGYIFGFLQSIHRVQREIKKYTIYTIVNQVIGFVLGTTFVFYFDKNIHFIFIGTIISTSIVLIFLIAELRNELPHYQIKFDKVILTEYYNYGLPMTFAVLASVMLNFSDRLVIHYFLTPTDVALYDVPARITEKSILLLLTLFETVDRPYILGKVATTSKDDLERELLSFVRIFLLVMVPVVACYFVFPKELIYLISDGKYTEAGKIIPIVALSYFFIGMASRYQIGSLIAKRTHIFYKISMLCGIINLVGNILFIPIYGYAVAAYTTLFSAIIYFVAHLYCSKKYFLSNIDTEKMIKFLMIGIILILSVKFIYLKLSMIFSFSNVGVLILFVLIVFIMYVILLVIFREHKSIMVTIRKTIKG